MVSWLHGLGAKMGQQEQVMEEAADAMAARKQSVGEPTAAPKSSPYSTHLLQLGLA